MLTLDASEELSERIKVSFRIYIAALSADLITRDAHILQNWLGCGYYEDNERELYGPLIQEIQSCSPLKSFSTIQHQIWAVAYAISSSYTLETQKKLHKFFSESPGMKEQLTTGFANSATRHFLRSTRARENSNLIDYDLLTTQKKISDPQSHSPTVMSSERLSNLRSLVSARNK